VGIWSAETNFAELTTGPPDFVADAVVLRGLDREDPAETKLGDFLTLVGLVVFLAFW
jgi:hypothetical protein